MAYRIAGIDVHKKTLAGAGAPEGVLQTRHGSQVRAAVMRRGILKRVFDFGITSGS
jgi:hypothetical protein